MVGWSDGWLDFFWLTSPTNPIFMARYRTTSQLNGQKSETGFDLKAKEYDMTLYNIYGCFLKWWYPKMDGL